MPALNFSKEFAAAVASGEKTQTIRGHRKDRPIKAGDTLFLFTGMRGKKGVKATRLGTVICRSAQDIEITSTQVSVNGRQLNRRSALVLSCNDGFRSHYDFHDWFYKHYGLPFHGVLIVWDKPKQP